MKTDFNLDRVVNAVPDHVGRRAFRFITQFDPDYPEACALGLGLALLRICAHWDQDPKRFMQVAEKIYQKTEAEEPYMRAVDQFIREEI